MQNLRFLRMSGPYRTGEVAGFEDEHAQRIIAAGAAEICEENPRPSTRMLAGIPADRFNQTIPHPSGSGIGMSESVAAARTIAASADRPPPAGGETTPVSRGPGRPRQSLGDAARQAPSAAAGATP